MECNRLKSSKFKKATNFFVQMFEIGSRLISRQMTVQQFINLLSYKFCKGRDVVNYQPPSLLFDLTDRCTLKCNMCVSRSSLLPDFHDDTRHKDYKNLTFERFKQVVDRFPKAVKVGLAGLGEPFLNHDLFATIEYAAARHMQVSTITNATQLHLYIDKIINSPLNEISISINAITPSQFAQISGASATVYSRILESVSALVAARDKQKKKLRIKVSFVCSRSNLRDMPAMVQLSDSLNVDELLFLNLIPSDVPGYGPEESLYGDDQEVLEVIHNLPRPKTRLIVRTPHLLSHRVILHHCPWFYKTLRVDGEGNISGCGRVFPPDAVNGNIFRDSDIWNGPYFRQKRTFFQDKSSQLPFHCKYCVELSPYRPFSIVGEGKDRC